MSTLQQAIGLIALVVLIMVIARAALRGTRELFTVATARLLIVGAALTAVALFCAFWVVQFIDWVFAFAPALAVALSFIAWGVAVIAAWVIAAEVCDADRR